MNIGLVPREDVNGPYSILTLNESGVMVHDLAGDGTLLFVGQVVPTPCFRVFHQETKQELGSGQRFLTDMSDFSELPESFVFPVIDVKS